MACHTILLTEREEAFIAKLRKLLDKAPESLHLFGWSGRLCVTKTDVTGQDCVVADEFKITGDGGDPDHEELCQDAEITYEWEQ